MGGPWRGRHDCNRSQGDATMPIIHANSTPFYSASWLWFLLWGMLATTGSYFTPNISLYKTVQWIWSHCHQTQLFSRSQPRDQAQHFKAMSSFIRQRRSLDILLSQRPSPSILFPADASACHEQHGNRALCHLCRRSFTGFCGLSQWNHHDFNDTGIVKEQAARHQVCSIGDGTYSILAKVCTHVQSR